VNVMKRIKTNREGGEIVLLLKHCNREDLCQADTKHP